VHDQAERACRDFLMPRTRAVSPALFVGGSDARIDRCAFYVMLACLPWRELLYRYNSISAQRKSGPLIYLFLITKKLEIDE